MTEPCKQELNIAQITAREEMLARTLDDIRAGQNRFIQVLEGIAAQGEQIKTLFNRSEVFQRDADELFRRMRGMELKVVSLEEFRKSHEQHESQDLQVSNPVKSGLIVAAIIAIAAFCLWLLDSQDYLRKTVPPVPVERKQKTDQKE
jgi:L-serine deaminase